MNETVYLMVIALKAQRETNNHYTLHKIVLTPHSYTIALETQKTLLLTTKLCFLYVASKINEFFNNIFKVIILSPNWYSIHS